MKDQGLEYAGFWVRTGATIIDAILLMMVTFPVLISIYGWGYFDPNLYGFVAGPADFLISWVLPAIGIVLFWVYKQATPGKMAVSVKVVDARTGNSPSVGQAMGRYLAYILSSLPLGLGFLWVAFDGKKQGWHDKLAGTLVVREAKNAVPVEFVQPKSE
ncbi:MULTISPECIES: RDD family protein [Halomonadaceae]|jgi:uncharacterized RDD family membrane protein YckC|uniref:RDD family protein n=1 Tax=Billgrantia aerodenitrificans TaxID=2733483 RepID=A0ABS9AN56_9GAMM|nr:MULTISPECIES: RDD family protein [Halomonas]MCE8023276.1 RDD family protein [Halomonas aerodenitrificans]